MKMKHLLLCAALFAAAGASSAAVHYECKQTSGKCPPPPPSPVPPKPPAPPVPPGFGNHPMPEPPEPPAIPAPPPPPPIPEVPEAAHAACAGKAPGTRIRHVIKKGETMDGICEREDGKMVFQLRTYRLED